MDDDPDLEEMVEYLEEVLTDYARHVQNIGSLGVNAAMLLYYRDEVQETLEILEGEPEFDTQPYWRKTVELDTTLKAHKQDFVNEVGHANFKQYQIINDPPRERWWWFLNTETLSPPIPPPFWQFWKK